MEISDYIEHQREFSRERRVARQEYADTERGLRAELHAKLVRLQAERDRKLDDIAHREADYLRQYRQWKQNWLADNAHRLDNPEPKQP